MNPQGLSAHYLVTQSNDPSDPISSPRVIQLVSEDKRAWHAGLSYWQKRENLNDTSIGIEIVYIPDCPDDIHYGSANHQRCHYPQYDTTQLHVLKALLNRILEDNPDIPPTGVIGHSDIAYSRKSDPGPRFPWQWLHEHGIGAWYNEQDMHRQWLSFNQRLPSIPLIQASLNTYGYGVDNSGSWDEQTQHAFAAFQMHFVSVAQFGAYDAKSAAVLFALIEKYFPDEHQFLWQSYLEEGK